MTRAAYGLDQVKVERYNATTTTTQGALAPDAQTTANIRLLDPNLISDAFSQLEQFRPYYQFPKALNVDRYMVDGKMQDTVIAVRELNPDGLAADQQSWLNRHVVYTHGYGVVAEGQQVHGRRKAGVPAVRHPVHRRPRHRRDLRAPHLLRRGLPGVLDRGCPGRRTAP
jgi:uncharacterized membrane protein (UPF0182 family)